jgi:hypothetical protein
VSQNTLPQCIRISHNEKPTGQGPPAQRARIRRRYA